MKVLLFKYACENRRKCTHIEFLIKINLKNQIKFL